MNTSRTGRVLVATSGSAASRSAIAYAAREALARGTDLEVVHVIPPVIAGGPFAGAAEPALRDSGREILAHDQLLAREIAPQLEVTTSLLRGSRADAVVRHAANASLLVIGTPPDDLVGRLWTGSTVVGIAARSTCPVAIVRPGEPRTRTARILVGLKSTTHSSQLLATAFALAQQTQSELRIVHAWHMQSPYDDAIAERLPAPDWEKKQLRAIQGELIDLRMAYPEVQVQVAVEHGQTAAILVAESRAADMLVISRPLHGGYAHHLGTAARAVIRDSACPVLVVPPAQAAVESTPVSTPLAS